MATRRKRRTARRRTTKKAKTRRKKGVSRVQGMTPAQKKKLRQTLRNFERHINTLTRNYKQVLKKLSNW